MNGLAAMDATELPKVFLSFWDIELDQLPEGVFRKRVLSTAEARSLLQVAREAKTLVCISRKDLGAPYETRARDRHEALCKVLQDHAGIEVHLRDFFDAACCSPSCLAAVTDQNVLLVVNCHYGMNSGSVEVSEPSEPNAGESAVRRSHRLIQMKPEPSSLWFHLFEQVSSS